jgi:ABC-type nitrate/sulfonate/bicarbonate transport system substrate-binding protein
LRQRAREHSDVLTRLVRAHERAALFIADPENGDEVASLVAAPARVGVPAEVIRRTLEGRLKMAPNDV